MGCSEISLEDSSVSGKRNPPILSNEPFSFSIELVLKAKTLWSVSWRYNKPLALKFIVWENATWQMRINKDVFFKAN